MWRVDHAPAWQCSRVGRDRKWMPCNATVPTGCSSAACKCVLHLPPAPDCQQPFQLAASADCRCCACMGCASFTSPFRQPVRSHHPPRLPHPTQGSVLFNKRSSGWGAKPLAFLSMTDGVATGMLSTVASTLKHAHGGIKECIGRSGPRMARPGSRLRMLWLPLSVLTYLTLSCAVVRGSA